MLPPQKPLGIGFFSNRSSDFRRNSRIHCGSLLMSEIWATTSLLRPFLASLTGLNSGSFQPYLYPETMSPALCVVIRLVPFCSRSAVRTGLSVDLVGNPVVALRFEFRSELAAARADDTALVEHVYVVRLHVVEDALVVGDEQDAHLLPRVCL